MCNVGSYVGNTVWHGPIVGGCAGGTVWHGPTVGGCAGGTVWHGPTVGGCAGGTVWDGPTVGGCAGGTVWHGPTVGGCAGGTVWHGPTVGGCAGGTITQQQFAPTPGLSCLTSGTCGPFIATNTPPMNIYCLTSNLSVVVTPAMDGLVVSCSSNTLGSGATTSIEKATISILGEQWCVLNTTVT